MLSRGCCIVMYIGLMNDSVLFSGSVRLHFLRHRHIFIEHYGFCRSHDLITNTHLKIPKFHFDPTN